MSYREAVASAAKAYLYRVLSDCGGNMNKAAQRAGVHRQTFYKLLEKHGIKVVHRKYVHQDPAQSLPNSGAS